MLIFSTRFLHSYIFIIITFSLIPLDINLLIPIHHSSNIYPIYDPIDPKIQDITWKSDTQAKGYTVYANKMIFFSQIDILVGSYPA